MAVRLSKQQAAAMGLKTKAAPRKRGMNKTEQAYADLLEAKRRSGEVFNYWFESVKLRIGNNCFLTVDFMVDPIGSTVEFHDVKARWSNGRYAQDDAIVKMRAAADKYPFKFVAAIRERDGSWTYKEF